MKKILLIATGGTIASAEEGSGLAPALTGEQLASAVPGIDELCDFDVVQPMNVDSTNMRPADWVRLAAEIGRAYDDYDGFVVLHGTDTMAYTAAALSYLVQGDKPIALTGSQLPMGDPFTDGKLNVWQAFRFAIDDRARGVCVVFAGKVIAGTRARKQRTTSFDAFESVNLPLVARFRGSDLIMAACAAADEDGACGCEDAGGVPRNAPRSPRVFDFLNERVCAVKLTPGMDPSLITALKPCFDAIVLEAFGIGGIPDFEEYRDAMFDWVDSGRVLVITTQVPEEGLDLGVYEVGRAYAEHPGILKGGDMTPEALLAKTMWALGQTDDPAQFAELFYTPVNLDRLC